MEAVKSAINRAFEALGSNVRACVEDGDLTVRDLIAVDAGDGTADVFEAGAPDAPIFSMPMGDGLAAAIALHVTRKIIANAIDA
jgi:hypothetical protein